VGFQTLSPGDGSVLLTREFANPRRVELVMAAAQAAKRGWKATPLAIRLERVQALVDHFVENGAEIARELSLQMGRPLSQTPGEIAGFKERAVSEKDGFVRFVRAEPLGCVLVLAPWNYPYLCAVNALVPALLAGNTVVLKHSDQTPLCAERLQASADAAGLPKGVFQHLHISHAQVAELVRDSRVDFVSFTGSVSGGQAVHAAAGGLFKAVGLELGGKDPAYIRADADPTYAGANVADGAFFNAGQSCCAVERVYVHASIYDQVVAVMVAEAKKLVLGDPLKDGVNLGPMVRPAAADRVRAQVADAIAAGAKALVDPGLFPQSQPGSAYMAPQVLVNVTHDMSIMAEESFGPVVGVMKVESDAEALALMNDSHYGLTASIWSNDVQAALELADKVEAGTVFLNRCDCLDPELAWVGVKDSGRGCTLSTLGFAHLTRPKSFHFRVDTRA
jgi:acyl-CoA reductase-like NAD-dependent aldehyde dehydrogenase